MKGMSFNKFFSERKEEMYEEIHTSRICEILKVDMNLLKADVLPLDDPDATPILDVPMGFQQTGEFLIQVPYKPGDKVTVIVMQRDIDPIMLDGGDPASRQFSADDAVISGGLNVYTKPLPNSHPDDVIITDKEFKNKIRIQPDGQIFMESEENINIISKKDVIVKGENIWLN